MNDQKLKIVILGLSITSSWGNGHATTYRSLVSALDKKGHDVLFLERDVPWYAQSRDLPVPPYGRLKLYKDINELQENFSNEIRHADMVIVGSYVPQGVDAGKFVLDTAEGLKAFYDIDTPVTFANLQKHIYEYISPELIPKYDLYLSFTGGPLLKKIENDLGSPKAKPFYCSFDPENYFPQKNIIKWDLGYLGTYSNDRQPALQNLLIEAAKKYTEGKFIVAGSGYPSSIKWNSNIERIDHLSPDKHCIFYNSQRFTLNITRTDMIEAGYSPSVRLFEAAACGTPIISDYWNGLDEFFEPGKEILISDSYKKTLEYLTELPDEERISIALKARKRVLEKHTAEHRAAELEEYFKSAFANNL